MSPLDIAINAKVILKGAFQMRIFTGIKILALPEKVKLC
jgi:hypothetical protein